MALFTAAERAEFASLAGEMLPHTYTRLRRVATGSVDDWNEVLVGDDPAGATVGAPCQYLVSTTPRRDETGKGQDERPALMVAIADPLAPGDIVSSVRDADGRLLLAGPAVVATVEPYDGGGTLLLRRARFESFSAALSSEIG
jgi:hypothetical protein